MNIENLSTPQIFIYTYKVAEFRMGGHILFSFHHNHHFQFHACIAPSFPKLFSWLPHSDLDLIVGTANRSPFRGIITPGGPHWSSITTSAGPPPSDFSTSFSLSLHLKEILNKQTKRTATKPKEGMRDNIKQKLLIETATII